MFSCKICILSLALFIMPIVGFTQSIGYQVHLTPFSSQSHDEFSPVFHKHGLVFCSNLRNNSLITYKHNKHKLFNIFYVANRDTNNWGKAELFSRHLTTNFNDGPVTFNKSGDTMYFCRNNNITLQLKDLTETTNTIGIYRAVYVNEEWRLDGAFAHNHPAYSCVTPALSADGKNLYFTSDKPGGFGGFDLYYSYWNGQSWSAPINLGAKINTAYNESYPFVCTSGKLFFASEGHNSMGGKDIFYSIRKDEEWIKPIQLDKAINSTDNDFGIVVDENLREGYFSSDRNNTDDIFHFIANPIQFSDCDSMTNNSYCFIFYDENYREDDTMAVTYEWDFGNGIKKEGMEIKHCFPGPGKYKVVLNVVDSLQPDTVLGENAYHFELTKKEQVFINSPDAAVVGTSINFDGYDTYLPGFNAKDYVWDFGKGFNIRGPAVKKIFSDTGLHKIKLGLIGDTDSLGNIEKACAFKEIMIYNDYQTLALNSGTEVPLNSYLKDPHQASSSDTLLQEFAAARSNKSKNDTSYSLYVKTYLTGLLSKQEMDTIITRFHDLNKHTIQLTAKRIYPDSDPVLKNYIHALQIDPDFKLIIAVHYNHKYLAGNNLKISETIASQLKSYFLANGVTEGRIQSVGYGDSRPLPLLSEPESQHESENTRIEFIFIKKSASGW